MTATVIGGSFSSAFHRIRSGCLTIVIIQHPAQTLSAPDCALLAFLQARRNDQAIFQSLVVAFAMVMRHEFGDGFRSELSPNRIIRSRQDSLIVRTNLSACAFKFGDRGGSFTD